MHLGFSKSIRVGLQVPAGFIGQKGGPEREGEEGDPPCTPSRSHVEARVFRRLTVPGEEDKFLLLVELA